MGGSGKILIVDDSAIQREILKQTVEGAGYQTLSADSGIGGIALAYQESPDLIISDVIMPEISGYHLCRFIKSDELTRGTPVILMTSAAVRKQDRFWGLKSGADAYIDKDGDPTALLTKISELIARRQRHGPFTSEGGRSMVQRSSPQQIKSYLNFLFDKLLFESTLSNEIRELGRFVHSGEELLAAFCTLIDSIVEYAAIGVAIVGTANPRIFISLNEQAGYPSIKKLVIELARKARAPRLASAVRRTSNGLFEAEGCELAVAPLDRYDRDTEAPPRGSCVSFPLQFRDEQLGAVALLSAESGQPREGVHTSLQLAIREFAPIVRTMVYYEEALRLSVLDALTGIFNRRHFLEALQTESRRYRRYQQQVSLVMFDLDGFKPVNDLYGHLAGDALLKDVAQITRSGVRDVDIPARYGGDEFVVLLPQTGLESARVVAERLRSGVEEHKMERDGEKLGVTGSFGVSVTSPACSSPAELIAAADKALYEAKQVGGNRVCIGGPVQGGPQGAS